MNKIAFADIKQKILPVLEKKAKTIGESVSLIDGFASSPFNTNNSDGYARRQ